MFKYFITFFVFLYFFCDVKTSYSQNTKDTLLKQNEHFSNAGYFSVENSPRKTLNFNIGWRFFKGSVEGAYKEDFDDNSWEGVNLPHGLEILGDNASGGRNYQGEAWYRKKFKISESERNARLFIYFEGIMGKSKVWINGKEIVSHYGGYLPFAADITDVVRHGNNDWLTNGNNLLVSGNVTSIRKDDVNIYDSPRFFMHTFLERLRGKGITTPQSYGFAELPRDSVNVERMACWNTSVQKVLNQLMKESDNLNAEAFLCRLGAQATGKKQVAAEDGIVEIMKLIRRLGHDPKDYKIADGCGLSNYNYLSPALLVDFLKYAYSQTEVFQMLYKSLPVGGVDGTLKFRMKGTPAFRNVHAKTGSFTAINALAGYLKMKNGHEVAFAIMNQNVLSAAKARAFQDKVCEVIIGK